MNRLLFVLAFGAFSAFAASVDPAEDGWWRRSDGFSKTFVYDVKDTTPIVVSGESRAENVFANEYCIYLDVYYVDGNADYRIRFSWHQGSHGWERTAGYFLPRAPVAKVDAFAFVRHGSGKAQYRNLEVARRVPSAMCDSGKWTLANPVVGSGCVAWCADSMERVTPSVFPADLPERPSTAELELCANERESFQVVLTAGKDAIGRIGAEVSIPGLQASWQRVGFFRSGVAYDSHSSGVHPAEKLMPDPLLPGTPFALRNAENNILWLTVYAPPSTEAGRYEGSVSVFLDGKTLAKIPVSVRVRGFEIPRRFSQKATYSVMDGFTRKFYPSEFTERKRQSWDLMLESRLSPDDIARTKPADIDDLAYAKARGMNLFTVANFVPPSKNPNACWTCVASPEECFDPAFYEEFAARFKPYVEELRKRGWLKDAFFYGFDEREEKYFDGMRTVRNKLRKDFPDVPLLTTAFVWRPFSEGKISAKGIREMADVVCPVMDAYNASLARDLRREGVDTWWYVCGGNPREPFVNLSSTEYPPVDARLVSWMTYMSKAGGFLYWAVNCWDDRLRHMDENEAVFDEWRLWQSKSPSDGVLMYPGKRGVLPSIRLAQVRDGSEDYEYFKLVEKLYGFEKAEKVVRSAVSSHTRFTRNPRELRRVRSTLADLIEARIDGGAGSEKAARGLVLGGLHGANGGKDGTRFYCRLAGDRLEFRFSVCDMTPCAPLERNGKERGLENYDRVEIFLSPKHDLSQRYCCIELGLKGDVLDYAAVFPRKMDYSVELKTLKVDTHSDDAVHTVSASVALDELSQFGIDMRKTYLGVFRADFAPDGKLVDWYSATPHGPGEPDFHRPCHFFEVNMRYLRPTGLEQAGARPHHAVR